MPLKIGDRLGPYKIAAMLGAGGMGEVYRAFDERLGRDVAIKVLSEQASADRDLQRRFAFEARAASALNHPNILTVHDVGMEGNIPYIVSELVGGESLRTMIERGPIPVPKALDIAVQVAGGLASAHHAGILHRDLKPANLMLTKDGFAKILDFGLAKTVSSNIDTGAHTKTENTSPGWILGTATYMSPEQAQGKPLDHRTDQFSFGLVLHEMFAGKPAFARSSAVSTMAAIVEEPAPSLADLNPAVPAPLRWCVERCLAKDRNDRYVSTADLQRELQTIRAHLQETTSAKLEPVADPPTRRRGIWLAILLGLAGIVAGVAITQFLLLSGSVVDLETYGLQPVASPAPRAQSPAWSSDGKSLAYSADVNGVQQIFVRDLSASTAAQITNSPVDCKNPFWLPDDTRVFYLSPGPSGTDLYAIGATGGSPQLIQSNASAATISPDGKSLAFLRPDPTGKELLSLWAADVGGGSPRKIHTEPFASGRFESGYLSFSRDGNKLGAWLSRWDGGSEFWILPWPSGQPEKSFSFVAGTFPFSWMPDNRRVVFGGVVPGSMGADLQVVDTGSGRLRHLTVQVKDSTQAAVSPDGRRIAFSASEDDFNVISVPLTGAPPRPLIATSRSEMDPAWSPEGDLLAVATDRTGTSQIWLRSSREGSDRPLVTEKDFGARWIASFTDPAFSPNGRRLAYSVAGDSGHSIYVSSVAGGKPIRLSSENTDERAPTWNPDGNWIAYLRNAGGRWSLVKASSGGGSKPTPLADGVLQAAPKWDRAAGHWIACMTPDGLTLISEDGRDRQVLNKDRWLVFGWSPDGRLIEGIKQVDARRRVIATLDVQSHAEKVIGDLQLSQAGEIRGFSLAPDGMSFATSASQPTGDIFILQGFSKPDLLAAFR
jgi:serine/threonine protein kinase